MQLFELFLTACLFLQYFFQSTLTLSVLGSKGGCGGGGGGGEILTALILTLQYYHHRNKFWKKKCVKVITYYLNFLTSVLGQILIFLIFFSKH